LRIPDLEPDKKYVIYYVRAGVKWYYADSLFKPFMPGLINAFLYHSREFAEKARRAFENDEVLLIEKVY
jgi:hypothetical protein